MLAIVAIVIVMAVVALLTLVLWKKGKKGVQPRIRKSLLALLAGISDHGNSNLAALRYALNSFACPVPCLRSRLN